MLSKEEAIKFAGSASELARILGISRAAVCQWVEIPRLRMYQLQEKHPEWFLYR
jgi:DNA-binding transcriptional regulator YdaS (Cro superfamily)